MCNRGPTHIPGHCPPRTPRDFAVSLVEEYDPRKEPWWPQAWWEWTYFLGFSIIEPRAARMVYDYFAGTLLFGGPRPSTGGK